VATSHQSARCVGSTGRAVALQPLGLLPEGYVYPKAERAVRNLLRKQDRIAASPRGARLASLIEVS
jgi:hypothetical protein